MSKTAWIIFAVLCVGLIGGLVYMNTQNRVDVSDVNITEIQPASEQSGDIADHVYGNPEAAVTIIEYGDFQCPGCGDAFPVLQQVKNTYEDDIAFVYRNFPLSTIHPNARAAAAAAEAAGLQDAYWEMHDQLFANQDAWSSLGGSERTDVFAGYAEGLGLDRDQFLSNIESPEIAAKINFDAELGKKAGVTGTPGIFVNGEKVDQYYAGDELVSQNTEGASLVWSNYDAFVSLILEPALREAGVDTEPAE